MKDHILYLTDEQRAHDAKQWLRSYKNTSNFSIKKDECGELYTVNREGALELVDSSQQFLGEPLEIRSL